MNQSRPESADPTAALAEALRTSPDLVLFTFADDPPGRSDGMRASAAILVALDAAGWSLVSARDREDEAWLRAALAAEVPIDE